MDDYASVESKRRACLNRMECYHALGEWSSLSQELNEYVAHSKQHVLGGLWF